MTAIAFFSAKGGSGKSTLAIHVAVAAARSRRVFLVDADPQRTAMMWASKRTSPSPQVLACDPSGIEETLQRTSGDGSGMAIVDCPPHAVAGTTRLLAAVDHVIVPVQPTMPDLAATQRALTMLKAAGKPFTFILSRAPVRSVENMQAREILHGLGPTAPITVHDRRAFARALIQSSAVTEVPQRDHSKAANEILELWEWLNLKTQE